MTLGQGFMVILLGLCGGLLLTGFAIRQRQDESGRRAVVMRAVAACTGMCSLALSREGAGTRDHTEGVSGCLGDMPAGYCLRERCDVIACPGMPGQTFRLEVARAVP
ncbi:MAG: hypothetical protein A2X46_07490 [Lentisphaerae bacterium GWF2_57_35]|nr:MAG: hypothetical protein A2X46_07490 [Lentisphaerae bacterium GWF2_57_35]